jgi:dTDP-4-dehydrorhamnose reductase
LNPMSLYAELKVEAEKIILDSGNNVVLRFATAFGLSPRMRLDLLINNWLHSIVKVVLLSMPLKKRGR